jgi:cytochrome c oxidase subunit 4
MSTDHHLGSDLDIHGDIDVDKHVRTYITVFVTLLALTLITVGIFYLHLPLVPAIALALTVAAIKGSLVACYFMHLLSERKLILLVMAVTVLFFLFVLLGPWLTEMNEITG